MSNLFIKEIRGKFFVLDTNRRDNMNFMLQSPIRDNVFVYLGITIEDITTI